MSHEELEALAVEVAKQVGGTNYKSWSVEFALAYLSAVQERMEPHSFYGDNHGWTDNKDDADRWAEDGDSVVTLYTSFAAPQEQKK